jgi:hypothetical protein
MLNNRMRFNNIVVKQHKGIAMGMSPAPTIANLYMSIFEKQHLLPGNLSHFPSSDGSLTTALEFGSQTPTQQRMS